MVWPFSKNGSEKQKEKICIPDARKILNEHEAMLKKTETEQKAKEQQMLDGLKKREFPVFTDSKPRLCIEGVFAVSTTLMLKGTVVSGKITKTSKLKIKNKIFKVKDLQLKGKSTGALATGQRGAIFFEKAKGLYLRQGDVLSFV
jgi:selenocysteine-specific translation elongation factor